MWKTELQVRNSCHYHPRTPPTPPRHRKFHNIQEDFDQNAILLNTFIKHSYQTLSKDAFNRKLLLYHIRIKNRHTQEGISSSRPGSKCLIASCKKLKKLQKMISLTIGYNWTVWEEIFFM